MYKIKKLVTKCLKFKHLPLILGVIFISLSLIGLHQFGYNSDDVAEQTILHSVQERGVRDTWLPPDPWILKYPLYLMIEQASFISSRNQILVSSLIMNTFLVCLIYIFALLVFRNVLGRKEDKQLVLWLILLWVFTLAPSYIGFLRMPNARNFELGILLIEIAALVWYYFNNNLRVKSFKFWVLFWPIILFNGLFFYSDPYVLVFLAAFILSFFVLEYYKKTISYYKTTIIIVGLSFAFLTYVLIKYFLSKQGFNVYSAPTELIRPNELGSKLIQLFRAIMYTFSFELPLPDGNVLRSILRVLNQILGWAAIIGSAILVIKFKKQKTIVTALALQPFLVIAAFVVTKNTDDIGSARYLLLLPLYLTVTFPLYISTLRNSYKKYFIRFVSAIIIANVIGITINATLVGAGKNPLISTESKASHDIKDGNKLEEQLPRNVRDYRIIAEIEKRGLNKGYGHYWESLIINHLSDHKIEIGQIICDNNGYIRPFYWVVQDEVFIPSFNERSFLIFNSFNINHTACNLRELGNPVESVTIDDHTVMFIYNYDVAKFFPAKDTLSKPY